MNIRQITPSGTFRAAEAELLRIKNLGVDVVWVMPIQPIGVLGRKGTLGSYYSIKNFTDFNPEFGTRADFESFVNTAHGLGLKVILDWVANHTAIDHDWTKNEDWHERDDNGSLKVQYDWTDISELNYSNTHMRAAMLDAMKFWIRDLRLDGFRCDMAMLIPTDFWENAVAELQKLKPDILMLAEAEEPDLMQNAFDIYYAWDLHHTMNAIAQGQVGADSLWHHFAKKQEQFPKGAIPMVFTSNHDENSWSGTEFERMGEKGAATFAAFCYIVPGIPLIYTGQATGNKHRLQFFEKDNIERIPHAPQIQMYTDLNALRKANPALWSGKAGGDLLEIGNSAPHQVFSVIRTKENNSVIGIFNLSSHACDVFFDDIKFSGQFAQFGTQEPTTPLAPKQQFHLEAWEYKIFVKK